MTEKTVKGDCYICGAHLGNAVMKSHILKYHAEEIDEQQCCLLKIERV